MRFFEKAEPKHLDADAYSYKRQVVVLHFAPVAPVAPPMAMQGQPKTNTSHEPVLIELLVVADDALHEQFVVRVALALHTHFRLRTTPQRRTFTLGTGHAPEPLH